jgi:hypothetical protein
MCLRILLNKRQDLRRIAIEILNLVATALCQIARAIMDRLRFCLHPANGLSLVREGPMTQLWGAVGPFVQMLRFMFFIASNFSFPFDIRTEFIVGAAHSIRLYNRRPTDSQYKPRALERYLSYPFPPNPLTPLEWGGGGWPKNL